jgi:competence protein ComGC
MKRSHSYTDKREAFSRLEFLACLAAAFLVFLVTLPSLANTRSRTQQAGCIDNLRRIGQAIQLWTVDHDNIVPWRISVPDGGTMRAGKVGNPFFEFSYLSNYVLTPKILVCPSDETRLRNAADNWGSTVPGGYFNIKYRNLATSYTVGLHSLLSDPNSYLSSDRNLRVDAPVQGCGISGINNSSAINLRPFINAAAWTNSIHGLVGNVLTMDGRVSTLSNPQLRSFLATQDAQVENGTTHLIIP